MLNNLLQKELWHKMRNIVSPQQIRLFDPFQGVIGPAGWKRIESGWQGVFRHAILKLMPVQKLGQHFSPDLGRPTKELYSMAGLILLGEFHNWTAEEVVDAYLFRADVQFALNLEPGVEVCVRTYERHLALFQADDLAAPIMDQVTAELAKLLELNIAQQRLDSTHVFSNMASFGRTRLMGVAIQRFLTQVKRHTPADFDALPEDFRHRYEPAVGRLFADAKDTEARQRSRQQVATDLSWVIAHFAEHPDHRDRPSYRALVTLFSQQCELVEPKDAAEGPVQLVTKDKTGGDVLQNPSDPDATYDGKKGQGYQVQLAETCHPDNEVQLLMAALPQTAAVSDASSLVPVLKHLAAQDLLPESMLGDTAYGGDDNVQAAKQMDVELISPQAGRPAEAVAPLDGSEPRGPQDFTLDPETKTITACPEGHAPETSTYNAESGRTTVTMQEGVCSGCPLLGKGCPIKQTKSGKFKLYFTDKEKRAAERRRTERSAYFRNRYRQRAGIESTNSGLKRRLGLGRVRTRGDPAVRRSILLRTTGWNILQASRAKKMRAWVTKKMAA
jgi:hypothetical protein